MCDSLLSEQTPQRLLAVRNNLYELLVHAIPPKTIIKSMVDYLVTRVDESLRIGIVEKAAFFEGRTKSSNKAIFHLEAFAVAVMTMIKSVSLELCRQSRHLLNRRADFEPAALPWLCALSSIWASNGMNDRNEGAALASFRRVPAVYFYMSIPTTLPSRLVKMMLAVTVISLYVPSGSIVVERQQFCAILSLNRAISSFLCSPSRPLLPIPDLLLAGLWKGKRFVLPSRGLLLRGVREGERIEFAGRCE